MLIVCVMMSGYCFVIMVSLFEVVLSASNGYFLGGF
jgi:hypothetical protein